MIYLGYHDQPTILYNKLSCSIRPESLSSLTSFYLNAKIKLIIGCLLVWITCNRIWNSIKTVFVWYNFCKFSYISTPNTNCCFNQTWVLLYVISENKQKFKGTYEVLSGLASISQGVIYSFLDSYKSKDNPKL